MKKFLSAILLLLLVCIVTHSLDANFGVKGGAGFSTFVGKDWADTLDSFSLKRAFFLGMCVGMFVTLSLSEQLVIESEALFLRVGGADKEEGVGTEIWISNYLAPAVLIKVRSERHNLFAGPIVMIKLGSGKYKFDPVSGSSTSMDFADDALTNFLFAATAGIGLQFPAVSGQILGELRGIYSFTSWMNLDLVTEDWKLLAVLVMLGYRYQPGQSRLR
jgi:hypothetical protein